MKGVRWPGPLSAVIGGMCLIGVGFLAIARVEEHDPFCASCHSQPEVIYVERAQAAHPVDLASMHAMPGRAGTDHADGEGFVTTRCIDCHSGPGLAGRAKAMTLGARDAIKWVTGSAVQPAVQTTPIGDDHCLKCHADTPNDSSFDLHFHRTLARWQSVAADAGRCVTCHTSHTTDGNPTLGFLSQQRTLIECERCHIALGVE